jgi:hypothetical protein
MLHDRKRLSRKDTHARSGDPRGSKTLDKPSQKLLLSMSSPKAAVTVAVPNRQIWRERKRTLDDSFLRAERRRSRDRVPRTVARC